MHDIITCERLTKQLAFAQKLEQTLRHTVHSLPEFADSLQRGIESLESVPRSAIASKTRDLDERGTTIWNLTSKYKEDATLAGVLALGNSPDNLLTSPILWS